MTDRDRRGLQEKEKEVMARKTDDNRIDIYTRITDRIVEDLEKGVRPWMKPWSAANTNGRISRPLRQAVALARRVASGDLGARIEVRGSDETAELLTIALEVCEKSGGALDITIAPASDLWDFKSEQPKIPDRDQLERAAKLVDYTKLKLEGDVVTMPAGMAIDLGAVAKGYIADKAAEYLKEQGVTRAILNLGGNVVALGSKPDGREWSIGIQDPEKENGKSGYSVMVADKSVVTSGIYQRGFDKDGVRYHHILDRATGWPVQNGLASVTIIADSSAMADAMSTACFVLGRDMGMSFAEEMGVQAVFIGTDGKVSCTPALEGKLEKTE